MLCASVDQQRQLKFGQSAIEGHQSFVRRIDELDGGKPFDEPCTIRSNGFQPIQRIEAVGIDARSKKKIGVLGSCCRDEFVRHVEFSVLQIQLALGIHGAIERYNDRV